MRLCQLANLHKRHALKLSALLLGALSCTPTSTPSAVQVEQQKGTDFKDVRSGIEKSVKEVAQPTPASPDVLTKSGVDEVLVNAPVAIIKADGSQVIPDGPVELAKYELPAAVGSPGAVVPVSIDVTTDSISLTTSTLSSATPTVIPTNSAIEPPTLSSSEVITAAVSEVGSTATGEAPPCASAVPPDNLKPNTDYVVATCVAGAVVGDSTTVTTLAKPVEVQSAVVTPDESKTKIVLILPVNQNSVEVAIAIVTESQVKWLDPATGELGLTEDEAYVPVLGKPEDPTIAEVHAATVPKGEFAVQVVTRNKKKIKTIKSKPVLGRGVNSAFDDSREMKRTAEQLVEEAEGRDKDHVNGKNSGKKINAGGAVNKKAAQLRQQLLWLQKDSEQRARKERERERQKRDDEDEKLDASDEDQEKVEAEPTKEPEEKKTEKAPKEK